MESTDSVSSVAAGGHAERWDEEGLRRETFDEAASSRIVLSDGQSWAFRRPRLISQVHVAEDGTLRTKATAKGHGATYGEFLDDLFSPKPGGRGYYATVVTLALGLLRENYHLPNDAVPDLFQSDDEDSRSGEMWEALNRLVCGLTPKHSPAG